MPADGSSVVLLTERAQQRLPAIVDDLMQRQWREVPEFFVTDDPSYREAVLRSTHENAELMLASIRQPSTIPRALGPGPRLEADVAAQHGAHLQALLRTYRLGQQAMIEHLIDEVERAEAVRLPDVTAALRSATRTLYWYMETVMPLVAREYGDERARLRARPDLARLRLVQAVLAGDEPVALEYGLGGLHAGIVARDERCERAVEEAALALGAAWLAVRSDDGRCWAWVGTDDADGLIERLGRAGLAGPSGVGTVASGAGGFRATHRQAQLAERIARARGDGIVGVRGAAIEALALGDRRTAWEVAHAELGPLARRDPAGLRLRATLEAWFAAHESPAVTADRLGVAARTVSYRLRRVEALLGCRISERRAEIEAALRLLRLFEAEERRQPSP